MKKTNKSNEGVGKKFPLKYSPYHDMVMQQLPLKDSSYHDMVMKHIEIIRNQENNSKVSKREKEIIKIILKFSNEMKLCLKPITLNNFDSPGTNTSCAFTNENDYVYRTSKWNFCVYKDCSEYFFSLPDGNPTLWKYQFHWMNKDGLMYVQKIDRNWMKHCQIKVGKKRG